MAQDWDIKPRSEACQKCSIPFADKQVYHAALVYGEQGYVRGDYCQGCWPSCEKSAVSYSMWKGVFRMPPPPPEEPLKKETAESMLRKLIQDEDDSKGSAIYILAVMLERKRVLVEKDVKKRPDGIWIRVYEHRKSGETFIIADPRLRLDQVEEVQKEVVALLGGGPSAVAPATVTPEPAPEPAPDGTANNRQATDTTGPEVSP
jgi:hypothetical protein